uniref:SCP domain-containing protein n=1 Tax=Biomphalaria glabrata TaxID=6526 RepID=A0A2C9LU83_BIOGL
MRTKKNFQKTDTMTPTYLLKSNSFYVSADGTFQFQTRHELIKRDISKSGFTAREVDDLVNLHNKLRADEHGLDMLNMSWNSDLENNAQNHANKCDFSHSSQSYRSNVGHFSYVGENLYAIGDSSPSARNIVETWYREKSNYDYGDNSCSGSCGHYTQETISNTDRYCQQSFHLKQSLAAQQTNSNLTLIIHILL